MYLLYVDESGPIDQPEKEHIVIGGVAIHEADVRRMAREVNAIFARHLDSHLAPILELHVQQTRKGRGAWRGIPRSVREELLADVAGLVRDPPTTRPFALLAVVREPQAMPYADPLERVYEELASRFNRFCKKSPVEGQDQYGMFVADEAKYEKIVQPLVDNWLRGTGARYGRLTRMVEVPLFVDSKASRLVQLADFVAHATFLAYEREDSGLLDPILPSFHTVDGVVHGLVHLTPGAEPCDCVACC